MRPRFSVIIPVLNLAGSIDLVMRCLEAQTLSREQFECIVIDDGSTDGTGEWLNAYAAPFVLTVARNSVTMGRSAARNVGVRRARGEIFVFLDGDMLPSPSWLSEFDRGFRTHDAEVLSGGRYSIAIDPCQAHANLCALLNVSDLALFRSDVVAHFGTIARRARLGQYPLPLYERLENELEEVCREFPGSPLCAFSFITSNVAVCRAAFERTHGFCAFISRLEDTELGLQLWEAGSRFGFVRTAAAYHLFYPVFVAIEVYYTNLLSTFLRHPYTLVLAMACWGLHRAPLASKKSLRELARCKAADLDIEQEFRETFNEPVPVQCRYALDEVTDYAAEQGRLPREAIQGFLQRALDQGLCANRVDERLLLDRHSTMNWLQNQSLFREADLRQSCCVNNLPVLQRTERSSTSVSFHCRGRYEVTVPSDLFAERAGEATMHLPLPIGCATQTNVSVLPFRSSGVTQCVGDDRLSYSWRVEGTTDDVVVGYDFSCDIHGRATSADDLSSREELQAFRSSRMPDKYVAAAEALLNRISIDPNDDVYAQAKALYAWILDHYSFRESTGSTLQVFGTGVGPCTHAAKLFIELCRLRRIPAREQCGALLQKVVQRTAVNQTVESLERGYSPFTHTWAEFNDPCRGWVSVEFLAWMLGARTLTARNVADAGLRSSIKANTALYDRFFFGHLDPFRIRSGASRHDLRTYPSLKLCTNWRSIHSALFKTRHRLRCTLTEQPAALQSSDK